MIGFEITILVLACLGLVSIAALGFAMKAVAQQIVGLWEDSTNRLEARIEGVHKEFDRIRGQVSSVSEQNYQSIKAVNGKVTVAIEDISFLKKDLEKRIHDLTELGVKSNISIMSNIDLVCTKLGELRDEMDLVPQKVKDPVVNVNIDGTAIKGTVKVKEMPEKKVKLARPNRGPTNYNK
jgi:hypothetical protein